MEQEQIIEKIVDETELEKEEVEDKVEKKMEEFEGLVSEEGAIHLVAKGAGVQLSEASEQELKIENIVPEMRQVNLKARVVNISDVNTFERDEGEEGKVQNIVLGDDSGTIRLTLWDEQTEIAEKVDEEDPISISGAYSVEDNQGNAELRLGDSAQVKMAEEDEVPEVESSDGMETTEADIREVRSENASYEIQGMIVDVYTSNPFYSTCPECGSTVRENDDAEFVCEEDGEVEPDKALAVSAVIDDGTGNIRTVFFRDRARELLNLDEEQEKDGDQKAVEEGAEEAIGSKIRLEGRTRYNDYFGTLEILADSFEQVDTEEQLEEMLETLQA